MVQRVINMPSGNVHSTFVIHSIRLFETKGVIITDARGRPLEWIPVVDVEKGKKVRDILTGALNGERRFRTLDWTFLAEPVAAPKSGK
jgi:hypothetical protein